MIIHSKNDINSHKIFKTLMFTAMNRSVDVVLTGGIVVLDKAKVSNCEIDNLELNMTYMEEGKVKSRKKLFHLFIKKRRIVPILSIL
jgi:hypothetical protein